MRLSHLGDVVHALPVYHALRRAYPEAEIGWAVQSEFRGLLEGLPGLGPIFSFDRRSGLRAWSRLRAELLEFGPAWAVDAQGNTKSAMVCLTSGAGRRTGLHRADWRERFAAHVMTDCAPRVQVRAGDDRPLAMQRMLALAGHVAHGDPDRRNGDQCAPDRLDPGLAEHELARGHELYRQLLGDATGALILHLSNENDVRAWPALRFEQLARTRAAEDAAVLVLSGPAEAAAGHALAERTRDEPRIGHCIHQRGLRELAALFTAAAERGARLVACDSGPLHLAGACGLPVVALFGPQDEARTGPWSAPDVKVLRARTEPACAPCLSHRCTHGDGPVCMRGIAVEAVHAILPEPLSPAPLSAPPMLSKSGV